MFEDIKQYSCSPLHLRMRVFEATWNASIDNIVSQEPCTRVGLPCTLHPSLVVKTKGARTGACDAKDVVKRRYQMQFQERLGVRAFFPEPQKGGNSNTGNVATRVFKNSAISAEIFQVPETLLNSLWELLKSISSCELQDIERYEKEARRAFDLWTSTFKKNMTANVHLLISHGALYLKWAQNEIGVPLGILTEGSIEKCNQDVKKANTRFVARVSVENIHRNILVRRSWESDPVLHYESSVQQVMLCTICISFVKFIFYRSSRGVEFTANYQRRNNNVSCVHEVISSIKYILKVKLNQNIYPKILSEIISLHENEGCGGNLAQISN